jgi:hypothetical protein
MKKKLLLAFLGMAICAAALTAQTLDEAILNAAFTISRDLPAGAAVAVIDFRSDTEELNDYVLNELYGAIYRNRAVTPVKPSPGQLQTIRNELNAAGGLNKESASSIGRLLGVKYLAAGSITPGGSAHRIVFNAVDAEGELQSQYSAALNPYNDMQLASLLGGSYASAASGVTQNKWLPRPANIRNNWVSGELLLFVFLDYFYLPFPGARYERMLDSKISLGAHIYYDFWFRRFSIDALFRFYPNGKAFYVGAGLGLGLWSSWSWSWSGSGGGFYMVIPVEVGWKIDVGKEGGFYIQPGIGGALWLGHGFNFYDNLSPLLFFGMGYAF